MSEPFRAGEPAFTAVVVLGDGASPTCTCVEAQRVLRAGRGRVTVGKPSGRPEAWKAEHCRRSYEGALADAERLSRELGVPFRADLSHLCSDPEVRWEGRP